MWITKPIVAFVSGAVFLVSLVLGAIGIAILLSVDIPGLTGASHVQIVSVLSATVVLILLSASVFTFQRFAIIQELRARLDEKRNLQERINHLARLRSRAINRIYSGTPSSENFDSWLQQYRDWKSEVREYLESNFPFAIVEMFADLGAIIPYDFEHASQDPRIRQKHIHNLRMLAKELTIIERVIRENTTLTLEAQPTFMEIVKWQEAS